MSLGGSDGPCRRLQQRLAMFVSCIAMPRSTAWSLASGWALLRISHEADGASDLVGVLNQRFFWVSPVVLGRP